MNKADPDAWAFPIVQRWQDAGTRYGWTLIVHWPSGFAAGLELGNPDDPRLSDLAVLQGLAFAHALAAESLGIVTDAEGRAVSVVV